MTDTPPKRASRWNSHFVPLIPIVLALAAAVAVHLYARGHPMFQPHGHEGTSAASHATTQSGSLEAGLRVGAKAPSFTLLDARGNAVSLDEELKRGPVLVVFYLGYNCNRCVKHLRSIEDEYADFQAAGVQVLAISPDATTRSAQRQQEFGAFPYPLLSDADRKVATAYDVYRGGGADFHGAFLIDPSHTIRFAYAGAHPYENIPGLLRFARAPK